MFRERHQRATLIACAAGGFYALLYLYAIDDLSLADLREWRLRIGSVEPEHMLRMRAPFLFEGVALLSAGRIVWLISPLNLAISTLLAALVATNVHGMLSLHAARNQCPVPAGSRATALGGLLPALLAGGACCAPTLVLIGIPGLAAYAALFPWLLPASVLLLLLSRLWQRRLGAPAFGRAFP
ncbi:MAG: hypothetical protein JJT90_10455 [Ectothiorhodospiraceae bacterium]|nr:hypothetical protein [Ectothiorhodospiraceae bacterium]